MRLADKVAFIAGAGGRQGTTVPVLFAKEGARLFLAGLVDTELQRIAERVRELGREVDYLATDLTETPAVSDAVERARRRFGRIDILYNNTGLYLAGEKLPHETSDEEWDALLSIDLKTHFLCARAVLPLMLEQGSGVILNVAAARAARLGGNAGYAAAKGGIIAMTQNMARRYSEANIRVNCICPTDIQESPNPLDPQIPQPRLRRHGTPEDVAYAALYLASDEAAWVTGIALVVDGGAEVSA
jgi:3-oxoacyl-[acyl-carrier protein] reductase